MKRSPMDIAFISPYPPLKDGLAGYTRQLVTELRSRGLHIGIISSDRVDQNEGVGAAIGLSPRELIRAYRYLRAEKPNVVHVQYTIPAFGLASFPMWALLFLARHNLKLRIIITLHEVKRETALLGQLGAVYIRCVAMLAHHITVHTHEANRLLAERCHIPAGKISYIVHPLYTYPLEKDNVTALRKRHNLHKRRVVLFFGFIHIDKGIDHLVRAFAQALHADARLCDTVLVIAGSVRKREGIFKLFEKKDIIYEANLHQLVNDLNISKNVQFTPYVPNEEVGSWFAIADVVVLPYTNLEQSGILNIALGRQTPMIVSELGGLGETMAGTNALVPPANDSALADKLRAFLTDKQQTQQLVAAYGRIRRERTQGAVCSELQVLYQQVQDNLP